MGDIYTQYTLYIRRTILRGPGAGDNGPLFNTSCENLNGHYSIVTYIGVVKLNILAVHAKLFSYVAKE